MPVQRPQSIRTLALILVLFGISALGGLLLMPWGLPLPVAPQLLHADPVVAGWIIFSGATVYCLASFICAHALWRMAPWAPAAYACFVASIALYMALFLYIVRVPSPLGIGVAFFGLLGAGLYFGWRIVGKAYGRGASAF
jgi:hypothetical protein